tara:strand:- start:8059 stop:8328 length:270 start_codon:yes stop_codon:yes gene_type:complete
MEKQIEIFTAGCPVCEPVVQLVKDTAGTNCEITIHNLSEQCESKVCVSKMEIYGVKRLPAIAVDGKLINCCKNVTITKDDLVNAGIGTC